MIGMQPADVELGLLGNEAPEAANATFKQSMGIPGGSKEHARAGTGSSGAQKASEDVPGEAMTIAFSNISGFLDKGFAKLRSSASKGKAIDNSNSVQLMSSLSGTCYPNSILALMGPSGSSKTLLLSTIGGRVTGSLRIEGQVTYNGSALNASVRRKMGFVAQMRPSNLMQRISGGERKRTGIGVEILLKPSVLMLDEPTNGLDSTTALRLMYTLRELASGGRAVVLAIHQPSYRLYSQLDHLLLMSEGHAIYYGNASDAASWFGKLGLACPTDDNLADFILDIASGSIAAGSRDGEQNRLACIEEAENYITKHPEGYKYQTGQLSAPSNVQMGEGNLDFSTLVKAPPADRFDLPGPTWTQQFGILLQRIFWVRRFEVLSVPDVGLILILGILSGLFWWRNGVTDTLAGARAADALLWSIIAFSALRGVYDACLQFPTELQLLKKDHDSGLYSLSAYYMAQLVTDVPIESILPTVYVTIAYWMGMLRPAFSSYLATLACVLLTLLSLQTLGLFIGAATTNYKAAQQCATLVYTVMKLISGFFATNIPVWIGWMKYFSFLYYGYSLLLKIQYHGRGLYLCGITAVKLHTDLPPGSCQYLATGKEIQLGLQFPRDIDETPWLESGALIGYFILVKILVFLLIKYRVGGNTK